MASAPSSPEALLQLRVQTALGQSVAVAVPASCSVGSLKEAIAAKLNIDSDQQQLVYAGRELSSLTGSLETLGVCDGATLTLHPVLKSGPINFRTVCAAGLPPPSAAAEAAKNRHFLRQVLRTMTPAAREQLLHLAKPVTIAAIVEQSLIIVSIPPGQVTTADLKGLDDDDHNNHDASSSSSSDHAHASADAESMRAKVERLKEQMRLKRAARAGGVTGIVTTTSTTPEAAAPQSASPTRSTSGLGWRRGFLLSPPPAPAASPVTFAAATASHSRRPRSATVATADAPTATGFASLRRGFLLSAARSTTAPRRSVSMAALAAHATPSPSAPMEVDVGVDVRVLPPAPAPAPAPAAAAATSGAGKAAARRTCDHCLRKLTLVGGFDCRCGLRFCTHHRFPEDHACRFDHRAAGRQELLDANPLVAAAKVPKL
jgi:hypothetical protein